MLNNVHMLYRNISKRFKENRHLPDTKNNNYVLFEQKQVYVKLDLNVKYRHIYNDNHFFVNAK